MPIEPTPVPPNDAVLPNSKSQQTNIRLMAIVLIVGIIATTLPQPEVLGKIPLQNLLKNQLGVSKTAMSSFFFVGTVAWYLKPLAGILTDAFPFFGTRRRGYLLVSSLFAALSWLSLGVLPHSYGAILAGVTTLNLFMVIVSTVVGAVLVEVGQSTGATGRLSALRQGVSSLCGLVSSPLSGLLATTGLAITSGVSATFVASIFPVAYLLLRERKIARDSQSPNPLANAGQQLRTIGKSRTLWFAILFTCLYYFSPGLGDVMYYRWNDDLHFSQQAIGNLGIFSGALGILGSLLYGIAIRRFKLRSMLLFAIGSSIVGLLYLSSFYNSYPRAILVESVGGFFGSFAEIVLLDIAARATPKGCEGLGYSLILSARNVAVKGGAVIGSALSDHKVPFDRLVLINLITSLCIVVFVPLLPKALMSGHDAGAITEPQPA